MGTPVLALALLALAVVSKRISPTASPPADRYADWFQRHPRDRAPPIEGAPAEVTRTRAMVGSTTQAG